MPAAPRNVVTGFNHNIRHNGKVYHVQTEDSGADIGHYITHVFAGGNILASKKTSYAELRDSPDVKDRVRELMEEQHKDILRNLIAGVYDEAESLIAARSFLPGQLSVGEQDVQHDLSFGAGSPAAAARPLPPEVLAAREMPAPPLPPEAEGTIFGEDLISEKSLDEVILSYLSGESEDGGNR